MKEPGSHVKEHVLVARKSQGATIRKAPYNLYNYGRDKGRANLQWKSLNPTIMGNVPVGPKCISAKIHFPGKPREVNAEVMDEEVAIGLSVRNNSHPSPDARVDVTVIALVVKISNVYYICGGISTSSRMTTLTKVWAILANLDSLPQEVI